MQFTENINKFCIKYCSLKEAQATIFLPIGVFPSLDLAIFSVTIREHGQIFVKKASHFENDVT